MARLRYNNVGDVAGSTNPVTLTAGGTTATWVSAPGFPAIASPDYAVVTVEPGTANEEIIQITAYTASATTATVVRNFEPTQGGQNSSAAHTSKGWVHAPTAADWGLPGTIASVSSLSGVAGPYSFDTEAAIPALSLSATVTTQPISLTATIQWSVFHNGFAKNTTFKIRRTNASGAVLWTSATVNPPADSTAGNTQTLTIAFTDTSPTDGVYVVTCVNSSATGSSYYFAHYMMTLTTGLLQSSPTLKTVVRPIDAASTSAGASVMGSFSTPWSGTIVLTDAGQSVQISVNANIYNASDSVVGIGVKRDGTLIYTTTFYTVASGQRTNPIACVVVDDTPGAGSHTYEVIAGGSGSAGVSVRNTAVASLSTTLSLGTGGAEGSRSVMVIESVVAS